MTSGYKIDSHKGIAVYVSSYGTFNAEVNQKEITDKTLEGLKEKLDLQVKTDLAFKPIDAIRADYDRQVRITSLDRSGSRSYGTYVWVSWKDEHGNVERGKEGLGLSDRYFKATPENLALLKQIEKLNDAVKALEGEAEALRKTYTDPVTEEDVGAK